MDVCVANAGARPSAPARLDESSEERIRETIEGSLLVSVWTARAFLASLAKAKGDGSALLFIGSTAATFGERGYADYATAKAGLLGLMLTLKNEIVAPGTARKKYFFSCGRRAGMTNAIACCRMIGIARANPISKATWK